MTTAAQVQHVIDELPDSEQEVLFKHLKAKFEKPREFRWPVPPPDVPKEELEKIAEEIEKAFPTKR